VGAEAASGNRSRNACVNVSEALNSVISSYIPIIRALDHARNQIVKFPNTNIQKLLIISMSITPNQGDLIIITIIIIIII
jgi:hypothetical protein